MDVTLDNQKRTPSRKECEEAIRRILITEILQNGKNDRFRSAVDFMKYFESLYPAGPALTKQVQRAVKAMDMPKDKDGYFLADKTHNQVEQDQEITTLLHRTDAAVTEMGEAEMLFLSCDDNYRDYLFLLIHESTTLSGKYITMIKTSDGILFFTENKASLAAILNNLIEQS